MSKKMAAGQLVGEQPLMTGPPSMRTRYSSLNFLQGGGGIAPSKKEKEDTLPIHHDVPTEFFNSRQYIGTLPARGRTPETEGWLSRFMRKIAVK